MSDLRMRELERRARAGDAEAAASLARARARTEQGGRIERAHAAWSGGDAEQALDELLELWRERKAPELADAIAALGEHVARPRGGVPGKTRDLMVRAWHEVEGSGDWFDVPRLMAALLLLRGEQAARCFETVEGWPIDPRVSQALVDMIVSPPPAGWTGDKHRPMWQRFVRQLERIGDPRTRAALAAAVQPSTFLALGWSQQVLPPIVSRLPAVAPTLSQAEAEALQRFVASFSGPRLEPSWDAVYDDPAADGPRHALAEALEARGDPRGEFMRLQLARAPGRRPSGREEQLYREHWREWAGSFLPYIRDRKALVFERGLPVEATVSPTEAPPAAPREWTTLRRLTLQVSWRQEDRAATLLNALPQLPPVVEGMPAEVLERGVACTRVSVLRTEPAELERLGRRGRASPALRALQLTLQLDAWTPDRWSQAEFRRTWSGALDAFWSGPVASTLEHVWLETGKHVWSFREALPGAAVAARLPLTTLRVTYVRSVELVYYREPGAEVWYGVLRPGLLQDLARDLEEVDALDPRLTRLRVEVPGWKLRSIFESHDSAELVARIERALARLVPGSTVQVV